MNIIYRAVCNRRQAYGRIAHEPAFGSCSAGRLMASCALGVVMLATSPAAAADCRWLGQSEDWFDDANWENCDGGTPTAEDDISIDSGVPLDPAIEVGGAARSRNVFLRDGSVLTVNGKLESSVGLIADLADPDATVVSVEGQEASWALDGLLSVGRGGVGKLDIADGGEVSNTGDGYIGEFAGSTGEVTVSGTGSRWTNADRLLVGVLGMGTLTIDNGAEVTNGTEAILGDQVSGSGVATVDDASWVSSGLFYVGNYGTGRVDIINGGSVASTFGTAGFYAGSYGEINVTGAGSVWTSSEEINIGNYGEGLLNITGGALVTGDTQNRIGNYADSIGAAIVSGPGSRWANAGTLFVGREGVGSLTVRDEGEVEIGKASGTLVVALDANASGTVNIGAAAGSAAAAPGILSAGLLVFGDGDGTLVFNHTDTDGDYNFSANIVGDGTIRQVAGSTQFTGDGSAFTGLLVVDDGDFEVQGVLGGEVRLEDKATMVINTSVVNTGFSISGGGGLFKTGAGELELTAPPQATFSGSLTVHQGLVNTSILSPGLTVRVGGCADFDGDIIDGELPDACRSEPPPSVRIPNLDSATACIGGTPSIGAMFIYSEGCVSPGNSIGTFRVANTWEMEGGAIYVVELKGGGTTPGVHSDLMQVDGTVVLRDGAIIHVIPENGSDDGATDYAHGSRYAIIKAGTLVVEGSTEISDAYAYLNFTSEHDGHNFYLISNLIADTFTLDGMTRNQSATADAAFALGAGNEIYDQVLNMDEVQALAAMDALSGEIHASGRTALIEESGLIRKAANDRIRAAFASPGATSTPVLAYGAGAKPALVAPDDAGPVFWVHGFGAWGSTESDGNAASLDRSIGGLIVGADSMIGDWRIGILAGYSHSSFDVDGRASTGSSSNYHIGAYGGTEWGPVAVRTGAAFSFNNIETSRLVSSSGLADALTSDYDAGTFQAFGELGYDIAVRSETRFEPFANLAHVSLSTDGFNEQGGAAALSGSDETSDVSFSTVGIRGEHTLAVEAVDASLSGMIGWRHAFGDTILESAHAFAAGDDFVIDGAPIAEDAVVMEAGLDVSIAAHAVISLLYQGQIASDAYGHGFDASLSVKF